MSINTYDIFISYRHTEKDRAWAKWLLEALETYRVPKGLQQRGFPARIGKAFRDEDELPTSADLSANIQQALEGSKFLVVICSKDTPSSLWVDKEVATFRKLGKGDHIIPVLVEGTPETSFPPSLLSLKKPVKQADGSFVESAEPLEPIAADVRERKDEKLSALKRLSLLRILSAILGCAFDDLRQRDHERQARKQRIVYSAAAVCSLLIVGGSLYLWDYNRLKVSYYNTIVYRWGVPEGVGKLSEETVKHKETSYRFESQKSKVTSVSRINSVGKLRENDEGLCLWIPQYRMGGQLEKLICQNLNERTKVVRKYEFWSSGGRVDSATVDLVNSRMVPLNNSKGGVNREMLYFDGNGYPAKVLFRNQYGVPKAKEVARSYVKVYGYIYKYDHKGRLLSESIADSDGKVHRGISFDERRYVMNTDGNVLEKQFYDQAGKPVLLGNLFKVVFEYDRWGNLTAENNVDKDGKLVIYEYARATYKYDERGNMTEASFWDVNNEPIVYLSRARETMKHDSLGYKIEELYYEVDGKLVGGNTTGYKYIYDHVNNMVDFACLDAKGKPLRNEDGIVYVRSIFDNNGNVIKEENLDSNRQRIVTNGVASINYNYDPLDNETEMSFQGPDGSLVAGSLGFARRVKQYDEKGYLVGESYYDPTGKLMMYDGYARDSMVYDDRGNITDVFYFGARGQPILCQGYHKASYKFDQNGHDCEWTFCGVKGEPVANHEGYFKATLVHDRLGNVLEDRYWGKNGKPVENSEGYHYGIYTYDYRSRLTEAYFGIKEQPVNCSAGYHRRVSRYDEKGAEIELVFLDARGRVITAGCNKKDGF
jgi:hypothetical protein